MPWPGRSSRATSTAWRRGRRQRQPARNLNQRLSRGISRRPLRPSSGFVGWSQSPIFSRGPRPMKNLLLAAAIGLLSITTAHGQGRPDAEAHDYAKWEKEVAAYEKSAQPAKGGILFIGSSTIRRW